MSHQARPDERLQRRKQAAARIERMADGLLIGCIGHLYAELLVRFGCFGVVEGLYESIEDERPSEEERSGSRGIDADELEDGFVNRNEGR